jgi:anti-anti-sigma regulatory factor
MSTGGSEFVVTVKPPRGNAPRAIEPRGPIDAEAADLLMRVCQFVTDKHGQDAVVDLSGVTAISSEAQRTLDSRFVRT